jgi:nucleotide-binding universal stress UspA family protein
MTMSSGDEARRNRERDSLMASTYPLPGSLEADRVRTVGPFRRVLVGFDGSPDATAAIGVAAAVAGSDGGHVVALCVVPRAHAFEGDEQGGENGGLPQQAEALFGEIARSQRPDKAVRMSVQVVYSDHGSPDRVVTDYAEQHGFDMLVLGRQGDGAHRKSRLGRVADRAAHTCSVPVLLLSAR